MSIRVMSAVWDHGPEDQGELLVLLALADYADDRGICWPSMAAIAQKARLTERGAQKIVRRLEQAGYVQTVVGGGRHGCNQYRITPNAVRPEPSSPPNDRTSKPRTTEHQTPNGGSPEPSRTIIREPSYNSADAFEEFWQAVPKKVGKGAARTAYLKAMKKADAATILAAMNAYAAERSGKDTRFTVHPATWLNQERWTDERPESPQDFHTQIDAMLRGNPDELRRTDAIDNGPRQPLLVGMEAPRAPDQRNRDDSPEVHRGGYQQAVASLIKPRGFGGGMR